MTEYRPRRQSKRWLDEDCPKEVLAIYDNGGHSKRNGTLDRYTILYVPARGQDYIEYLGASEDPFYALGFGQHGEFRNHYEAAAYRYRVRHQAAKWSSLPEQVKKAVRDDCRGLAAFR